MYNRHRDPFARFASRHAGAFRQALRVLWLVLVLVAVLDPITTLVGFSIGLHEANPISRALIAEYGTGVMWLQKLAVVVGSWSAFELVDNYLPRPYTISIPATAVCVQTWIVATNVALILPIYA